MRLQYFVAIALIAASGLGQTVSAKTLAEASSPVNFPPDDFNGRSFVDNDGCVYIRAGVDGATTWVPRVTRSRQVICGQRPTFGNTQVAAAPAARSAPEPTPVPTPAPRAAAPAPTPAPTSQPQTARRVVAAPAAPQQAQPTRPTAVRRVAPAQVLAAPAAATSAPQPTTPPAQRRVVTTTGGGCANAPASSRPFFNRTGARCGPQAESPSSGTRIVQPGERVAVAGTSGSVTRRVMPPIPEGYRRVWTDGRLNPFRGLPRANTRTTTTVAAAQTTRAQNYDLAWTRNEPHLLFDRRTGIVVGDEFPQLVYPNTDLSAVAPATQAASQATVSTKRAPVAARAPAQAVSNRHVQVATFADMAAAQVAAQRLANTGLRTRIGKYSSGGERRQVIVLGPFSSNAETNKALNTARGMGFSSAVARK